MTTRARDMAQGELLRSRATLDTHSTEFDQLYRDRRLVMVRLASVLTGSTAIAEEVVQDAFIQLSPHLDHIDDPAAYLRKIVANLCQSHLRRRKLERRLPSSARGVTGIPEIDETWLALCKLPFRQRAVVVLRFYEDLTEADIARLLDCRVGTVKSNLHRGLAKLRKELDS